MPYVIFAELYAKEGKTSDLLDALKKVAQDAGSKEPGTLQYQVSQGDEDPRRVVVWEEYEDQAAHEAHRDGSNFKDFKSRIGTLIDGDLKITKFHRVAGHK